MKTTIKIICLILLIFFFHQISAQVGDQYTLYLARSSYKNWVKISHNKKITVFLIDPELEIKGNLTGVNQDSIEVSQKWIKIDQIRWIKLQKPEKGILISVLGIGLIAAGESVMDEQFGFILAYPAYVTGSLCILLGVYSILSREKYIMGLNNRLVAVKKNE